MQLLLLFIIFISLVTTNTFTSAEVVLDGTLGHSGALPGPNYLVGAELGQQHGGNLFHSFHDFNLKPGDSATFSGPNSVHNVIGRVTGGNPSYVDGLIRTTIPNADMYLTNPYGMMFGPNASLDVQGSFHASTADYFRLGENGRFNAREPNNSLLTVAPVSAFGFVTDSPASLSMEGHIEELQFDNSELLSKTENVQNDTLADSKLFKDLISENGYLKSSFSVPPEKTLSFIGGNLQISKSFLTAISGRINLVSVAGLGEVIHKQEDLVATAPYGNLTLQDSMILTARENETKPAGDIYIRAGQFLLEKSIMLADTYSAADAGNINVQANDLTIRASALTSDTYGAGKGGTITMKVNGMTEVVNSIIEASAFHEGDGGNIELETSTLSLNGGSIIGTSTGGQGKGGHIKIQAKETISLSGNSSRFLEAVFSESDNPNINNNIVIMIMMSKLENTAVDLKHNSLPLTDDTKISGGPSTIIAITTGQMENAGESGIIEIKAKELYLMDEAMLSTGTIGKSHGGKIKIQVADVVKLAGNSLIGAITTNAGQGGNLEIETQELNISEDASISVATFGSGQGGQIQINAEKIIVKTDKVNISEDALMKNELPSGIYAFSFPSNQLDQIGDAGDIWLDVSGLHTDGAIIFANTFGMGQGGSVKIDARQIHLKDAAIGASTTDTGQGGQIVIEAQELNISGQIYEENEASPSGIYAFSDSLDENAGNAGNILLKIDEIRLTEGANINALTMGPGQGGTVVIHAQNINLNENSRIGAVSKGQGHAGGVTLKIGNTLTLQDANIDTRAEASHAHGGDITIDSQRYLYLINSGITTSIHAEDGSDGNIILNLPESFIVLDNSRIIAETQSQDGGDVDITTKGIYQFSPSIIKASGDLYIEITAAKDSLEGFEALSTEHLDLNEQLHSPCEARAENRSQFVVVKSRGTPIAPDDLLPSGSLLLEFNSVKPMKSTKEHSVMAKPFPKIAFLTGCSSRLSKLTQTTTKSSLKVVKKESSVIPKQLF